MQFKVIALMLWVVFGVLVSSYFPLAVRADDCCGCKREWGVGGCNISNSGCTAGCPTIPLPYKPPTSTPPPGNTPTPTPTGGGGGGNVPSLTPVPPTACTISCSHQVCGDTSSACSSNADCSPPHTCNTSSGRCQLCTNPGAQCCGYCVPQGWGCSSSSCATYKSCKAWQGTVLICDILTGCSNANPCASAPGATTSSCDECFEYCGAGNPGGAACSSSPPAVTNIQPSGAVSPGTYSISWTPVAGATSYYLAFNGGNNPWTCDANCNNCQTGDICSFQTATSYSGANLNYEGGYGIWVFALNDCGWSPIAQTGGSIAYPTPTPTLASPTMTGLSCVYPKGPINLQWTYPTSATVPPFFGIARAVSTNPAAQGVFNYLHYVVSLTPTVLHNVARPVTPSPGLLPIRGSPIDTSPHRG